MLVTVRYIGLDVHKDTIVMAVAEANSSAAEVFCTAPHDLARVLAELRKLGPLSALQVCYEAGPTGYGLQRFLTEAGVSCQVVAPSLIPQKNGQRIKTDRRDARRLAHFLRSGDLTPVWIPDEHTEALRDLERSRDDAKRTERTARHQLSKFLLRQGRRYEGRSHWTQAHWRWIGQQTFSQPAHRRVLEDYLHTAQQAGERVARLDRDIAELVETWALGPVVKNLQAFYGVQLITAVGLVAEIGDFRRFETAGRFMAFVGLVPSEHSSGGAQRRGGITKTGNQHVRRLLVEATWHYFRSLQVTVSAELKRRREGVPQAVIDIADKARRRLARRAQRFRLRGKSPTRVVTALARELAGFLWAAARASWPELPPQQPCRPQPRAATPADSRQQQRRARPAATSDADSVPPGACGQPRGPDAPAKAPRRGGGLPRRYSANVTRRR